MDGAGLVRAVSADGTAIACRRSGSGPSLVLVHGGGLDARQWDRVVPLLERDFTAYTLDRRGRGASGPIRAEHSVAREAEDIAAAVRLVPAPVHLLGHSSGARYAMEAALLLGGLGPGTLGSLVLYEPSLLGRVTPAALAKLPALEKAGDRDGVLRLWQVDVIGNTPEGFAALRAGPAWPFMLDNALTLGPELRALAAYEPRPERFAGLRLPTLLLLGGASDAAMRATVEEVHTAMPRSELVTLAGQRHAAMYGAPELFADEVRRFLVSRDHGG